MAVVMKVTGEVAETGAYAGDFVPRPDGEEYRAVQLM